MVVFYAPAVLEKYRLNSFQEKMEVKSINNTCKIYFRPEICF